MNDAYFLLSCGGGEYNPSKLIVLQADENVKRLLLSRLNALEALPYKEELYAMEYWFSGFDVVDEQFGLEALNFPEDAESLGREVWVLPKSAVDVATRDLYRTDCKTMVITSDGAYLRFRQKGDSYEFESEIIPAELIRTFEGTP